ncbi:MAG: outer membrane lipoprotein-sorting protein [Chlorobi bacterium]|nr:outer membrane lipoprotein-sorting protein [Chlorobiota bacterium]
MKTRIFLIVAGFLLLSVIKAKGQEEAKDILSKMDDVIFSIKDKTADVKMVLINLKNGKENVKKAVIMQKGHSKKMFRYVYPKSDSGIATLTLPGDQIYLYLPLFKSVKKISSNSNGGAFNKSDFSLRDTPTKPYSELYTPKLEATTDTSYILTLIPKADKWVYGKLVATIDKTQYYLEKLEYYSQKGQKLKEAVYHYKKIDSHWVADKVTMTNAVKQHKTVTIMSNIKINTGLNDDLFTIENLKGGKK